MFLSGIVQRRFCGNSKIHITSCSFHVPNKPKIHEYSVFILKHYYIIKEKNYSSISEYEIKSRIEEKDREKIYMEKRKDKYIREKEWAKMGKKRAR